MESLLLLQHQLLLLGRAVGYRVIMALAVSRRALDRVAATTGIVNIEKLTHLLFTLLVLLPRQGCLARATRVVRENLDIERRLRAICPKERIHTDIVKVGISLTVRSSHRLIAQKGHRVLLSDCRPGIVDTLVLLVRGQGLFGSLSQIIDG